jgi:uncharacterized protein with HEPN domain
MNQADEFRILHMIDAATETLSFVNNITKNEFKKNRIIILSVVKEIEIIGEAASKISKETIKISPDIPWKDIIGMRNRLIHGYFEVDIDLVWYTLKENLPPLVKVLNNLISYGKN